MKDHQVALLVSAIIVAAFIVRGDQFQTPTETPLRSYMSIALQILKDPSNPEVFNTKNMI